MVSHRTRKSPAVRAFCALLGIAAFPVLGACGHAPEAKFARQAVADDGPQLDAQNLPPDKELDVLMTGKRSLGRVVGAATRIAVPPFKVLGAKNDWMGEAASVVTAARLSQQDGVSVLDRSELTVIIDELKRSEKPDPKKVAKAGQLLGAQQVLLGTLMDAGSDRMRLVVEPVRVEDGVVLRSTEASVRVGSWMDDLEQAVAQAMTTVLDGQGAAAPSSAPLGPAEVQIGAHARALQYQGDLLSAEPLYEKALARPSSAWGLEADYVRLMNDLGMSGYASDRARSVMGRMPTTAEMACDRARLQIQATRHEFHIEDAREAVRLAASCGDKVVEAGALRVYGQSVEDVDYRMAQAAWDRAKALLGSGEGNAYERAWLEYNQYGDLQSDGLDERGVVSDVFARIAQRLEQSGNLVQAAYAYEDASRYAMYPAQRKALLDKGLALAQRAGGIVFDSLRLQQAASLRKEGQPSKADQLVLKIIGERLDAIASLSGGLPGIEHELDEDLLTAAGIKDLRTISPGVPDAAKLLVSAHRVALASALRSWADRTAADSAPQAKAYRATADKLDPPSSKIPDDETPDARFQRQLADAKLTFKDLTDQDDAPLRASVGNLSDLQGALWDRFYDLRSRKDASAEIGQVIDAAMKVATWDGAPRLVGNAYRLRAQWLLDQGKTAEAIDALKKARVQMVRAPWFDVNVRYLEIQAEKDPAKHRQMCLDRAAAAKDASLSAWVDDLRYAASENARTDHDTCVDGVKAQMDAAKELEDGGDIEDAASALSYAATTINECLDADGSPQAMQVMDQRAHVIDKLGDPLRSLQAKADVLHAYRQSVVQNYRAGVRGQLLDDPWANGTVREIRAGAEALASAGRYRDAARVAAAVMSEPRESAALLHEALDWSKKFQDSVEYPLLTAGVHSALSDAATDDSVQVRELTAARELYALGKDRTQAINMQRFIMTNYSSEAELAREFDKCLTITNSAPDDVDECFRGYGDAVIDNVVTHVQDRERIKGYLKIAKQSLPHWEHYAINYLLSLKTDLALMALLAGDADLYKQMNDQVKTYYSQTAPDAYQLATYYNRVANGAQLVDLPLYFSLNHAFDDAHGASAYWKASSYLRVAEIARGAKNKQEEKFFFQRWREAAQENSVYSHWYPLYGVGTLVAGKHWQAAAQKYEQAAKMVTSRPILGNDYAWAIGELRAMGGDLAGARAALEPVLDRIARDGDASQSPCFDSLVLETAASMAGAAHECSGYEDLRQRAARVRNRCVQHTVLDDGNWTDGPEDALYRAPDKCGARFLPDAARLPLVGEDEAPAVDKMACDMGDPGACNALAWKYYGGDLFVQRDNASAFRLFKKACDAGNQSSCAGLADMMLEGRGGTRDDARAHALMRAACDAGDGHGCTREGELLLAGTGAPKDQARAVARLERGCTLGSKSACEEWIENGGQP